MADVVDGANERGKERKGHSLGEHSGAELFVKGAVTEGLKKQKATRKLGSVKKRLGFDTYTASIVATANTNSKFTANYVTLHTHTPFPFLDVVLDSEGDGSDVGQTKIADLDSAPNSDVQLRSLLSLSKDHQPQTTHSFASSQRPTAAGSTVLTRRRRRRPTGVAAPGMSKSRLISCGNLGLCQARS